MPRHQLTPEERRKGGKTAHAKLVAAGKAHKLTADDARKGARAIHAYARTIGVHVGHQLTHADRVRGGLVAAAKRRKERERALITLALPAKRDTEHITATIDTKREMESEAPKALGGPLLGLWTPPAGYHDYCAAIGERGRARDAKRETEAPSNNTPVESWPEHEEHDPYLMGASLADELMAGEGASLATIPGQFTGIRSMAMAPPVDPFTLSALKRFRLGPKSPLHLTRGQRAQVDLMVRDGWLEATGDSMLQLTSKGWQAIEAEEDNV